LRHPKDSKNASNVNSKNDISIGWDRAIAEAQSQLSEMKTRTALLKAAIKLFTEKKKNGDPWIADQKTAA